MKIAIAQINCIVGDLKGNAAKILEFVNQAKAAGADIVLAPELSLTGYPPEDLLLRDGFYSDCERALKELSAQVRDIVLVVGHPAESLGKRYNTASVIQDGRMIASYHKFFLPNYTVFDEERYFNAGTEACVFEVKGIRLGINICADVWDHAPVELARIAGAQVLLVLNASPYHINKQELRYEQIHQRIQQTGMAIIYANMVGGQDELVFDGASFVMDNQGNLTHQFPAFVETLGMVNFKDAQPQLGERVIVNQNLESSIYQALCLGVKDYVEKNNFPGVLLGLSGGIDSALTLAIAVDALGAKKVKAVMMPSPYTSQISLEDSRQMAKNFDVQYEEIPIASVFREFIQTLEKSFENASADTTEENIQARIRGTLLMALSNKYGSIVLTTGNKSEMSVGYATLYGDMAGGFAVLKDVSKTLVYRLARYRNTWGRVIPDRVITRAPTAELKANQTDQDNLPPYEILDPIMEAYVEQNLRADEIITNGYNADDVHKVVSLIKRNEYKRRQAPIGTRITPRGFGKDWRYPITSHYNEFDRRG